MTMRGQSASIDREKVLTYAARLNHADLLFWLSRTLECLDDEAIEWMIEDTVDPDEFRPGNAAERDLLAQVREFHANSLDGHYYQSFNVNSRNYRHTSEGTRDFIADHERLVDLCIRASDADELAEAREGIRLLVDLLDEIDEHLDDIIFFADEAGSWQVNVDWDRLLPAWAKALSPVAAPQEWAATVARYIDQVFGYSREALLEELRNHSTDAQFQELERLIRE